MMLLLCYFRHELLKRIVLMTHFNLINKRHWNVSTKSKALAYLITWYLIIQRIKTALGRNKHLRPLHSLNFPFSLSASIRPNLSLLILMLHINTARP